MKRHGRLFLALSAAGFLVSCARPTTTAQSRKTPVRSPSGPTTGKRKAVQRLPVTEESEEEPEPVVRRGPARQPAGDHVLKRRPHGGLGRGKPLEADLGNMTSGGSESRRAFRIIVIKNMAPSHVRQFRRAATRELQQKNCSNHENEAVTMATVSFSRDDRIRVTGATGRLARCIKAAFRPVAGAALEHRTAESQPVTVQIQFLEN